MESAKLAEDLSQLVISGINDKQPEIYDQTKKAMRKYLGSERSGISIKERIKVKDEVLKSTSLLQCITKTEFILWKT